MSLDFQYIEHNFLIIEESFYNLNEREFKLSHINKFFNLAPKINKKKKTSYNCEEKYSEYSDHFYSYQQGNDQEHTNEIKYKY